MSCPPFRWLVVTDASVADGARTIAAVERLAATVGGASVAIGLRDHGLTSRRRLELGRELRRATRALGATLLVFDRIDLAIAIDADGVHLGERSVSVVDARALLPHARWVGRSCHDFDGLRDALACGADYATLSPIFPSPDKGEPIGVERAREWISACGALPIFALGGVDADTFALASSTGAHGFALIRGALGEGAIERLIDASRAR
ncbi:MAG: thiamine phosphate synthase [Polyangiales bacterium]